MRKIFLVIMACLSLCMQAAVVEQTYEHEFTTDETFKSLGTWSLSGYDWNVQAVQITGEKTPPCSWNDAQGAQQIASGGVPAKTVTISTSAIPGTITGITLYVANTSKAKFSCEASVGGSIVSFDQNKSGALPGVGNVDAKPLVSKTFSGSGELKLVFTNSNEDVSSNVSNGALIIKKIIVKFTAEASELVKFVPGFEDVSISIGQNKDILLPSTHPSITFASSNSTVVDVEDGQLIGKKEGYATVTATWDADDVFLSGSASFMVVVDENKYLGFDFVNKTYGMTPGADQHYGLSEMNINEGWLRIALNGDYCLVEATEENPEAGTSEQPQTLRLGASDTSPGMMTISVPDGGKIIAVEFVGNNVNKLKSDKGETVNAKWRASEGEMVKAVTFTPSGDCKVKNVYVTYFYDTSLGIKQMDADNVMQKVYFDLNGKQVNSNSLTPGIYIVRQGVKTQKIIIK